MTSVRLIAKKIGPSRTLLVLVTVMIAFTSLFRSTAEAQQKPKRDRPSVNRGELVPIKPAEPPKVAEQPKVDAEAGTRLAETVQADVSTRNVAVTSSFTGTEIVVFGAVDNSRQESPQSGLYDVVVVIEGVPSRVSARRKSRVGGIWLNTQTSLFDDVPSYYAISSTRPLDEIAPDTTLIGYEIGFDHVRMTPIGKDGRPLNASDRLPAAELKDFREAVIRLKKKDGLYVAEEYSVAFIGRSLFRSTISLPANVPVGPFVTRVYLFRDQQLLSQYNVRLNLEREGLERVMHEFALKRPLAYGLATVFLAVLAGLAASAVFRKGSH